MDQGRRKQLSPGGGKPPSNAKGKPQMTLYSTGEKSSASNAREVDGNHTKHEGDEMTNDNSNRETRERRE
jgi:hypothetical protein